MSVSAHTRENYEHTIELMGQLGKAIPKTMATYNRLHTVVGGDGALDHKTKELMALAIAVSVRCDGCIAYHANAALDAGATYEEIVEALGVAILMGGGPAVMYSCDALAAVEELLSIKTDRVEEEEA
jgi:AhpD family alkylhydroperoxidase